ncbi:ATP-binding protein [bacterium]|nr:ATP-binding protein [bacterium]
MFGSFAAAAGTDRTDRTDRTGRSGGGGGGDARTRPRRTRQSSANPFAQYAPWGQSSMHNAQDPSQHPSQQGKKKKPTLRSILALTEMHAMGKGNPQVVQQIHHFNNPTTHRLELVCLVDPSFVDAKECMWVSGSSHIPVPSFESGYRMVRVSNNPIMWRTILEIPVAFAPASSQPLEFSFFLAPRQKHKHNDKNKYVEMGATHKLKTAVHTSIHRFRYANALPRFFKDGKPVPRPNHNEEARFCLGYALRTFINTPGDFSAKQVLQWYAAIVQSWTPDITTIVSVINSQCRKLKGDGHYMVGALLCCILLGDFYNLKRSSYLQHIHQLKKQQCTTAEQEQEQQRAIKTTTDALIQQFTSIQDGPWLRLALQVAMSISADAWDPLMEEIRGTTDTHKINYKPSEELLCTARVLQAVRAEADVPGVDYPWLLSSLSNHVSGPVQGTRSIYRWTSAFQRSVWIAVEKLRVVDPANYEWIEAMGSVRLASTFFESTNEFDDVTAKANPDNQDDPTRSWFCPWERLAKCSPTEVVAHNDGYKKQVKITLKHIVQHREMLLKLMKETTDEFVKIHAPTRTVEELWMESDVGNTAAELQWFSQSLRLFHSLVRAAPTVQSLLHVVEQAMMIKQIRLNDMAVAHLRRNAIRWLAWYPWSPDATQLAVLNEICNIGLTSGTRESPLRIIRDPAILVAVLPRRALLLHRDIAISIAHACMQPQRKFIDSGALTNGATAVLQWHQAVHGSAGSADADAICRALIELHKLVNGRRYMATHLGVARFVRVLKYFRTQSDFRNMIETLARVVLKLRDMDSTVVCMDVQHVVRAHARQLVSTYFNNDKTPVRANWILQTMAAAAPKASHHSFVQWCMNMLVQLVFKNIVSANKIVDVPSFFAFHETLLTVDQWLKTAVSQDLQRHAFVQPALHATLARLKNAFLRITLELSKATIPLLQMRQLLDNAEAARTLALTVFDDADADAAAQEGSQLDVVFDTEHVQETTTVLRKFETDKSTCDYFVGNYCNDGDRGVHPVPTNMAAVLRQLQQLERRLSDNTVLLKNIQNQPSAIAYLFHRFPPVAQMYGLRRSQIFRQIWQKAGVNVLNWPTPPRHLLTRDVDKVFLDVVTAASSGATGRTTRMSSEDIDQAAQAIKAQMPADCLMWAVGAAIAFQQNAGNAWSGKHNVDVVRGPGMYEALDRQEIDFQSSHTESNLQRVQDKLAAMHRESNGASGSVRVVGNPRQLQVWELQYFVVPLTFAFWASFASSLLSGNLSLVALETTFGALRPETCEVELECMFPSDRKHPRALEPQKVAVQAFTRMRTLRLELDNIVSFFALLVTNNKKTALGVMTQALNMSASQIKLSSQQLRKNAKQLNSDWLDSLCQPSSSSSLNLGRMTKITTPFQYIMTTVTPMQSKLAAVLGRCPELVRWLRYYADISTFDVKLQVARGLGALAEAELVAAVESLRRVRICVSPILYPENPGQHQHAPPKTLQAFIRSLRTMDVTTAIVQDALALEAIHERLLSVLSKQTRGAGVKNCYELVTIHSSGVFKFFPHKDVAKVFRQVSPNDVSRDMPTLQSLRTNLLMADVTEDLDAQTLQEPGATIPVSDLIQGLEEQLPYLQQLQQQVCHLCCIGHFQYHSSDVTAVFECDLKEVGNIAIAKLKAQVARFTQDIEDWNRLVTSTRLQHYFLNFMTMDQLWHLKRSIEEFVCAFEALEPGDQRSFTNGNTLCIALQQPHDNLASFLHLITSSQTAVRRCVAAVLGNKHLVSQPVEGVDGVGRYAHLEQYFLHLGGFLTAHFESIPADEVPRMVNALPTECVNASDMLITLDKLSNPSVAGGGGAGSGPNDAASPVDLTTPQDVSADITQCPIWLAACGPDDAVDVAMSVYMRRGKAPEPGEIVFCDASTTLEEIQLAVMRITKAFEHGCRESIVCFVNVDELVYSRQVELVGEINKLKNSAHWIRNCLKTAIGVLLVSADPHSYVASECDDFKVTCPPLEQQVIQGCLERIFAPSAKGDHRSWPSVACVRSVINGGGKTHFIQTQAAISQLDYIKLPVQENMGTDLFVRQLRRLANRRIRVCKQSQEDAAQQHSTLTQKPQNPQKGSKKRGGKRGARGKRGSTKAMQKPASTLSAPTSSAASTAATTVPMDQFLHIDLGHSLSTDIGVALFQLLVLGCVSNRETGQVYTHHRQSPIMLEVANGEKGQTFDFPILRYLPMSNQPLKVQADQLKMQKPVTTVKSYQRLGIKMVDDKLLLFVGQILNTIDNEFIRGSSKHFKREFDIEKVKVPPPQIYRLIVKFMNLQEPARDGDSAVAVDGAVATNAITYDCTPSWNVMRNFVNCFGVQMTKLQNHQGWGEIDFLVQVCNLTGLKDFRHQFVRLLLATVVDMTKRVVPRGQQSLEALQKMASWEDTDHPVTILIPCKAAPLTTHYYTIFSLRPGVASGYISDRMRNEVVKQLGIHVEKDWGKVTDAEARHEVQLIGGIITEEDIHENADDLQELQEMFKVQQVAATFADPVSPGYVMTVDNLAKMLSIMTRIETQCPVIIMGETGCGKTSLIRAMCGLLHLPLRVLNIHGGTTAEDVISWVKARWKEFIAFRQKVLAINRNGNTRFVVFLDEVNTAVCMQLFKELICDHTLMGRPLSPDFVIVAACNPCVRKKVGAAERAGLHMSPSVAATAGVNSTAALCRDLQYTVHPLPAAMLDSVYDFGALTPTTEKMYLVQKIKRYLDKQSPVVDVQPAQFFAFAKANGVTSWTVPDNEDEPQFFVEQPTKAQITEFTEKSDADQAPFIKQALWTNRRTRHRRSLFSTVFSEFVAVSQEFVRTSNGGDRSAASLRDVDRCLQIFIWFAHHFARVTGASQGWTFADFMNVEPQTRQSVQHTTVMAISFCYYARLDRHMRFGLATELQKYRDTRTGEYVTMVANAADGRSTTDFKPLPKKYDKATAGGATASGGGGGSKSGGSSGGSTGNNNGNKKSTTEVAITWSQKELKTIDENNIERFGVNWLKLTCQSFANDIYRVQCSFVSHMNVGKGIAVNEALRENLFMLLVSVMNRIPIFVVGVPGSSKSLAMHLLQSNLRGKSSRSPFFRNMDAVEVIPYQCSPQSTSDGITEAFNTANRISKAAKNTVVVVLLDEVGLAEYSPHMPLKVLHKLLDEASGNQALVGISNWSLDPAKMNRAVHLFRPAPTASDLAVTAGGIVTSHNFRPYLKALAQGFYDVMQYQKTTYKGESQSDFWGLREFYCLVKHISRDIDQMREHGKTEDLDPELFLHAIQRNFGGRLPDMDAILNIFFEQIGKREQLPRLRQQSMIELVQHNLEAKQTARHLMVLAPTSATSAMKMLFAEISGLDHSSTEVIFGSEFPMDKSGSQLVRHLQTVKSCMAEGRTVVLVHSREGFFETLYDLLNQNYTEHGHQLYSRLAFGNTYALCPLHPNFRVVVIVTQDAAYTELAAPLLNRFEKQVVSRHQLLASDSQHDRIVGIVTRLWTFVEALVDGPETIDAMFEAEVERVTRPGGQEGEGEGGGGKGEGGESDGPLDELVTDAAKEVEQRRQHKALVGRTQLAINGFHNDSLLSLVQTIIKLDFEDDGDVDGKVFRECACRLLSCCTPEVVSQWIPETEDVHTLRTQKRVKEMIDLDIVQTYFSEQQHATMTAFLDTFDNSVQGHLVFAFTYSPLDNTYQTEELVKIVQAVMLHQLDSEVDLIRSVSGFLEGATHHFLVMHCDMRAVTLQRVEHVKYVVEREMHRVGASDKNIIIVVHTDRNTPVAQRLTIDYDDEWTFTFLDSMTASTADSPLPSMDQLMALPRDMTSILETIDMRLLTKLVVRRSLGNLHFSSNVDISFYTRRMALLKYLLFDDAPVPQRFQTIIRNIIMEWARANHMRLNFGQPSVQELLVRSSYQHCLHHQIHLSVQQGLAVALGLAERNKALALLEAAMEEDTEDAQEMCHVWFEMFDRTYETQLADWVAERQRNSGLLQHSSDMVVPVQSDSAQLNVKFNSRFPQSWLLARLINSQRGIFEPSLLTTAVTELESKLSKQLTSLHGKDLIPSLDATALDLQPSTKMLDAYFYDFVHMLVADDTMRTVNTVDLILPVTRIVLDRDGPTPCIRVSDFHLRYWKNEQQIVQMIQILATLGPDAQVQIRDHLLSAPPVGDDTANSVDMIFVDLVMMRMETMMKDTDPKTTGDFLRILNHVQDDISGLLEMAFATETAARKMILASQGVADDDGAASARGVQVSPTKRARLPVEGGGGGGAAADKSSDAEPDVHETQFISPKLLELCNRWENVFLFKLFLNTVVVPAFSSMAGGELATLWSDMVVAMIHHNIRTRMFFKALRELETRFLRATVKAQRVKAQKQWSAFFDCYFSEFVFSTPLFYVAATKLTNVDQQLFLNIISLVSSGDMPPQSCMVIMRSLLSLTNKTAVRSLNFYLQQTIPRVIMKARSWDTTLTIVYVLSKEALAQEQLSPVPATRVNELVDWSQRVLTADDVKLLRQPIAVESLLHEDRATACVLQKTLDTVATMRLLVSNLAQLLVKHKDLGDGHETPQHPAMEQLLANVNRLLTDKPSVKSQVPKRQNMMETVQLYFLKCIQRCGGMPTLRVILGRPLVGASDWCQKQFKNSSIAYPHFGRWTMGSNLPSSNPVRCFPNEEQITDLLDQYLRGSGEPNVAEQLVKPLKKVKWGVSGGLLSACFHKCHFLRAQSIKLVPPHTLLRVQALHKWLATDSGKLGLDTFAVRMLLRFTDIENAQPLDMFHLSPRTNTSQVLLAQLMVHWAAVLVSAKPFAGATGSFFLTHFAQLLANPGKLLGSYFVQMPMDELYQMMKDMVFPSTGRRGRWFYCRNGHPYCVDACGRPTQVQECQECHVLIGGIGHDQIEYIGDWNLGVHGQYKSRGARPAGTVERDADVDPALQGIKACFHSSTPQDNSKPDYSLTEVKLGDVTVASSSEPLRTSKPVDCRVERLLLHMTLSLGTLFADEPWVLSAAKLVDTGMQPSVRRVIAGGTVPDIHLELQRAFSQRSRLDWARLRVALGNIGEDEVAMLTHGILSNLTFQMFGKRFSDLGFVGSQPPLTGIQALAQGRIPTQMQRQTFEHQMGKLMVQPVTDSKDDVLRAQKAKYDDDDERAVGEILVDLPSTCEVAKWLLQRPDTEVKAGLPTGAGLFPFRKRYAWQEFQHLVFANREKYPLLAEFVVTPRKMRAMHHLANVLTWMKMLLLRYNRRITAEEAATKLQVQDVFDNMQEGSAHDVQWRKCCDGFMSAWKEKLHLGVVIECGTITPANVEMTMDSPLGLCIASNEDQGLLPKALVTVLVRYHNNVRQAVQDDLCRRLGDANVPAPREIDSDDVGGRDVVFKEHSGYDAARLAYEQQMLRRCVSHNARTGRIEYDLELANSILVDKFLSHCPTIKFVPDSLKITFMGTGTKRDALSALRHKIRQQPLPPDVVASLEKNVPTRQLAKGCLDDLDNALVIMLESIQNAEDAENANLWSVLMLREHVFDNVKLKHVDALREWLARKITAGAFPTVLDMYKTPLKKGFTCDAGKKVQRFGPAAPVALQAFQRSIVKPELAETVGMVAEIMEEFVKEWLMSSVLSNALRIRDVLLGEYEDDVDAEEFAQLFPDFEAGNKDQHKAQTSLQMAHFCEVLTLLRNRSI